MTSTSNKITSSTHDVLGGVGGSSSNKDSSKSSLSSSGVSSNLYSFRGKLRQK